MKKIVVTGMGAVTPVGIGVENYWNNITAGASGIDTIKTLIRLNCCSDCRRSKEL